MNTGKQKAVTALTTCKGQIEGIISMIEGGRYCIDISNQLLAVCAGIRRANKLILAQHMENCVMDAIKNGNEEEKINEITGIINKLLD
jgi:DNA-binding FrmR family transcriptional regulator